MRTGWLLAVIVLLAGNAAAQQQPVYAIYLTAAVKADTPQNQPSTEFGCNDKIFAVVEAKGLPKGKHVLEATWRDPHGKDREHTRYPFIARYAQERVWVWLKLHRSPEAALVQFMDPSAGMGEFVGEWQVKFHVDGHLVDKKRFNVVC